MPTRKWGLETVANSSLTGDQTQSSVAGLADGGFVVVWVDENPADSVILAQRYNAVGAKVGTVITVSASASQGLAQTEPSVTGLEDGGFFVSWDDFDSSTDHDIVGAVFDANGNYIRQQSSATGIENTGNVSVSQPGSGIFGGSVAAWSNLSTQDINLVLYDVAGTPGSVMTVNGITAGIQRNPSVATSPLGLRVAVTWSNAADATIRGKILSSSGNPLTDDFVVGGGNFTGDASTVTWLNSSIIAVAWQETFTLNNLTVWVRLFDTDSATGTPLTGPIRVSSSSLVPSQTAPMITNTPNGGFVVAWQEDGGVGGDTSYSIRLQTFDGSGGKIGGEMLVNTTTDGTQTEPSIAVLADGRVVVSWTDHSSGNDDIRAQIVDPRDGIVNGTVGADKLYGHDSVGDIISANNGADTVFGLGGADTIYGGKGSDNLYGGRGDDTVYGEADGDIIYGDFGDDEQYGGDGNDIIYSGAGGDLMDGGAGTGDAAFYVNELLGAVVNLTDQLLTSGSALGDTLFNFERVYGSVRGANNLTGDNNANILVGGLVNDTLNGGGGADVLRGWGGVDTMAGGLNNDIFQYTGNTEGGDIITDFAAGDKFQFVRTAFGNLAGANVAAVNFLSVASGHAATNASQRFIFDQATKQLWYDANGNVAGGDVMIADLSTSYNILNTDLLLA